MNTTALWISAASLFARSGDGIWSRDARNPTSRRTMSEEASRTSRDGLASIPSFLSFARYTVHHSLSLSPPFSLTLSPWPLVNPLSTNHQTTGPDRNRIAPHRIVSHHQHRSLSLLQTAYSPLLLGLLLTLSYPIIGYTRATPLLSTACGTIKSQLSYQRTYVSHPCVRGVIIFFIFFM